MSHREPMPGGGIAFLESRGFGLRHEGGSILKGSPFF